MRYQLALSVYAIFRQFPQLTDVITVRHRRVDHHYSARNIVYQQAVGDPSDSSRTDSDTNGLIDGPADSGQMTQSGDASRH